MQEEVRRKMRFSELLERTGRMLSPEQLDAVCSDRSTVVSAGAGAGKTMVLALRFLRLVMEGKAHADEILTLTFTRKAAGEMYDRIHSMLVLAASDGDERLAEELSQHFPRARISTMDSFWSEIARTDSLRYGVTRDFSSLDEGDAEDMARTAFEELQDDAEYSADLQLLASEYSPENLLSFFLSLSVSHADLISPFTAKNNMESFDSLSEMIRQSVVSKADSVIDELAALSDENPTKVADEITASAAAYRDGNYGAMTRIDLRRTRDKVIGSFVKDAYRPVLERLQELDSLEKMRPFECALSHLAEAFICKMKEAKRASGMLSYRDIESLARTILLENKDVRSYYKRCFRYIMVDEFQDNNADQRDMLYLLAERTDVSGDAMPEIKDTDPEKLFFVGDDKQSIYYFRGADVSVFRSLRRDIASIGGNIISLTRNYRSEPELIRHFNDVFCDVFSMRDADDESLREERLVSAFTGADSSSYEADSEPIVPREPSSGVTPVISLALYRKDTEQGENSAEPADCEALYVASLIEDMVSGDEYLIADRSGGLRRPHYSDIAILVQTTKSQMPFERALRVRGIPYTVVESASTTLDGVASDIYSFLQVLLYPNDRFAYLALLRSPFARISDDGLLLFAPCPDAAAFREDPAFPDPADAAAYSALKALYLKVRSLIGRERLTHILDVIYYESGYHAYLAGHKVLSVYEDHFAYIWSLAASMEAEGRSLPAFVDTLRPLIGSVEKLKDVSIQHFSGDSVQMMTIHKSKGLEFPIVILADVTRGLGTQKESFTVMQDGARPLVMLEPRSLARPVSKLFSRYSRRREAAERKRALYVAVTRAMAHLVVTGVEKRTSDSLYDLYALSSALPAVSSIPCYDNSMLYPKEAEEIPASWYSGPLYEPGEAGEQRIGVRDSVADVDNSFVDGELLPSLAIDDLLSKYNLYTDFGIMVHSALENLLADTSCDISAGTSVPADIRESLTDAAQSVAASFLSSGFYAEFVAGRKCEEEVRFYYPSSDGIVVEGSVDLLIHDDDRLVVVDYKTDRVRAPEMHKAQVVKYAGAIEDIYGKRCFCCILYVRDWSRSTLWDRNGSEV